MLLGLGQTIVGVAGGGDGGSFCEAPGRSQQDPRVKMQMTRLTTFLLSLCSGVMVIAPLQAAGAETTSVAFFNSKHEKGTSWQRGKGQQSASFLAVAACR